MLRQWQEARKPTNIVHRHFDPAQEVGRVAEDPARGTTLCEDNSPRGKTSLEVPQNHWMVGVARKANFPMADAFELSPAVSVADAWEEVVSQCGVSEEEAATAVADFFRLPVADLDTAEPTATKLLPGSIAHRFGVFPVRDKVAYLAVATANPPDLDAEKEVSFVSGRQAKFEVAAPTRLREAIEAAYSPDNAAESLLSRMDADSDLVELVEDAPLHEDVLPEDLDAAGPVVRLTNMILQEAVAAGASDIHVQPLPQGGHVRYRVDGVLRTGLKLPLPVLVRVVSRIKIMSRLNITDHLRPQDGRARILVKGRKYDLRVSTVPTRHAEKAVIRILDPFQTGNLEDTGVSEREIGRLREMLRHRDGIVVVTGPTGSGKTTTMYAALRELATEDVNIMTVEDPVEYELAGLTQIQVEPKQGVTFSSALRAILRQDPDVIFIGEIRDLETAQIAAQASLTGHLVLATVHANDAVGAVRRFLDLGLDAALISETLRGALAQRLLRTVCSTCAVPWAERTEDDEVEAELGQRFGIEPQVRTVGCPTCGHTGYLGRYPVVELVAAEPEFRRLISEGASHVELVQQTRGDGTRTLTDGALDLVKEGRTTLREVERSIGKELIFRTRQATPDQTTPAAIPPIQAAPIASPSAADTGTSSPAPPELVAEPPEDEGDPDAFQILLVEDDADTRLFVRHVLEQRGFVVTEVIDGGEALLALAKEPDYDLMVLDLGIPRLDGRDVLKATRASLTTASLPVVVLTASTEPGMEIRLLAEGADDYLHKPIDPDRLLSRITAALRRANG